MIPEVQATKLLEEHGFDCLPIDPFKMAESLEIEVQFENYGSAFEGMLIVNPDSALMGLNTQIKNQHRKIYTCAHELAHFTMDIGPNGGTIKCSGKDMESFSKKMEKIELRANQFAAEFLLPKFLVQEFIQDSELSWHSIKKLSEMTNVSLTAAARKFMEHTEEACSFIVSENGQIKWFQSSPDFLFRIDMMGRILSDQSKAHGVFKGQPNIDDFSDVAAQAWVDSGAKPTDRLLEWSLPLDSYGRILTLLWDDQGLAEKNVEESAEDSTEDNFDPEYGWETPTFHKSKRR